MQMAARPGYLQTTEGSHAPGQGSVRSLVAALLGMTDMGLLGMTKKLGMTQKSSGWWLGMTSP